MEPEIRKPVVRPRSPSACGSTRPRVSLPGLLLFALAASCAAPETGDKMATAGESESALFVHFNWESGSDDFLTKLGRQTIDALPPPDFPVLVKAAVESSFETFYQELPIILSATSGPDIHTVTFTQEEDQRALCGRSASAFGCAPVDDCGNHNLSDASFVFLHKFLQSMSNLDRWAPMSRDDPAETRVQDLGEAIGRVAAHEFAHSLGLVLVGCGDLTGCPNDHNGHETVESFGVRQCTGSGQHLMDRGWLTRKHWRLALATPQRGPRTHSTFRTANRQYVETLVEE